MAIVHTSFSRASLAGLLVVNGIVAWISPVADHLWGGPAYLAAGAGLIGVVSFVWIYAVALKGSSRQSSAMRTAIAATIVIVYITIVAWGAFFAPKALGDVGSELAPLTQTVLGNFTLLTGVVVASYFGATAYTTVSEQRILAEHPDAKIDGRTAAGQDHDAPGGA